jgi:hypothetical protein
MIPNELHEVRARQADLFIERLKLHGRITQAAEEAGLVRETMHRRKESDPEFAARWAEALDTYADSLEAAAHQRAVEGTKKAIIHQGQLSYVYQLGPDGRPLKDDDGNYILDLDENGKPKFLYEKQYSDSLLLAMLKAKRKREYGDASKIELTGADGGPVAIEETPTQIARKIAFALALGLRAAKEAPQQDNGEDLA